MPDFSELQAKIAKDVKPMSAKSPFKPHILDQAEREPANLRQFLFRLEAAFSEEFIEGANFTVGPWFYDEQRKIVFIQFKNWLWGEHLETQVVYLPKNWFEHFRAAILPEFILDRWPIQLQEIHIDINALYPQLRQKLAHPGEKHAIHGVVTYGANEEELAHPGEKHAIHGVIVTYGADEEE
jgi:hypothetical protein